MRRRALSRRRRSIPACAGEPRRQDHRIPQRRVYPRVCGGTNLVAGDAARREGLSPRVRGNLVGTAGPPAEPRSIPACAGEPSPPRYPAPSQRVYPRVCGGTAVGPPPTAPLKGLSPRVRGNHTAGLDIVDAVGSIPACAGEPARPADARHRLPVYPRVCGGTAPAGITRPVAQGLSPRVRGNLAAGAFYMSTQGSIPACAGEPDCRLLRPLGARVYPRVCGGTGQGGHFNGVRVGLSPRVRGNHL